MNPYDVTRSFRLRAADGRESAVQERLKRWSYGPNGPRGGRCQVSGGKTLTTLDGRAVEPCDEEGLSLIDGRGYARREYSRPSPS